MANKRNRFEEYFLISTMAIMVVLIFGQVVGRYVFGSAPSWTEELSRYVHIFQVWVGAGYAVKLREHIRIESLVNIFNGTMKKIIDVFALLIWFGLALFLAFFGTMLVLESIKHGQVSPAVQVPIWIPYLAVPIGGISMSVRLIQQLVEIVKSNYDEANGVES